MRSIVVSLTIAAVVATAGLAEAAARWRPFTPDDAPISLETPVDMVKDSDPADAATLAPFKGWFGTQGDLTYLFMTVNHLRDPNAVGLTPEQMIDNRVAGLSRSNTVISQRPIDMPGATAREILFHRQDNAVSRLRVVVMPPWEYIYGATSYDEPTPGQTRDLDRYMASATLQ